MRMFSGAVVLVEFCVTETSTLAMSPSSLEILTLTVGGLLCVGPSVGFFRIVASGNIG